MANDKTLKQLEQIIKHRKRFSVRSDANEFTLDAVNGTAKNTADVLATVIEVLKKQGILE